VTLVDAGPRERSALEHRAFLGFSMAATALSIDLVLPAFSKIRSDLGLAPDSAATAALITVFFLGLALGQIPWGLYADKRGRRATFNASAVVFIVGAVAATLSPSLAPMIVARFVWGVGAAGMRLVATTRVRDRYVGAAMAREMTFVFTVFMVVPVAAPALGSVLIRVLPWRSTFAVCAAFTLVLLVWHARMPETLPPDRRQPMELRQLAVATRAIVTSRGALGYTLAMMPMFGAFSSYLASSERILDDVFGRGAQFPLVFGGIAIVMTAAAMGIGRHVERIGLDRLILGTFVACAVLSVVCLAIARAGAGRPSFWPYIVVLALLLAAYNVLFPNLNAAAMVPVGHVAGTAAAIIGTVSTVVGAIVGAVIDHAFDGTVNPFSTAWVIAAALSLVIVVGIARRQSANDL
jgi:MFS transporter, DHA1 family, multidrug resistance protein